MKCRRARRALAERLDDRLDARQASELSRHLGECARCRRLEAELARIEERMRQDLPEVEPDARLRGQVLADWRAGRCEQRSERKWAGRVAIWATATAAAALVLVTLVGQIRSIQRRPVTVRLELPQGTVLTHEPELTVVRVADR